MGVKFGMEEGTFLAMPNFTPTVQRAAPAGRKKTQNRPLSNLNNRRFALRAVLPVNNLDLDN